MAGFESTGDTVGAPDAADLSQNSGAAYAFDPTPNPLATYGAPCSGSGGFAPELSIVLNYDGCFVPGENVPISLTKALGGGTALLFLSAGQSQTPLPGTCTLHIAPAPVVVVTFPVGGTGPGNGVSFLTGTIPLAMPAASIYTQLLVLDPGAPAGFSATNGLRITVH